MPLTPAEQLLQELGVTEPDEIDLVAIAQYVGARVRYHSLDGCEARIIGNSNSAIITVNNASPPRRKRFSIAHELGHWHHHRGKSLVCRVDEYQPHHRLTPERIADAYAADLLMPNYLFQPLAQQQGKLTLKVVATLADAFKTSRTATAIRLVDSDLFPALLVCHGQRERERKWFTRAPSVPDYWFPNEQINAASSALDILYGRKSDDPLPRKISAGAWFNCREALGREIQEQTMRTTEGEVITLLTFNDTSMLNDRDAFTRNRY